MRALLRELIVFCWIEDSDFANQRTPCVLILRQLLLIDKSISLPLSRSLSALSVCLSLFLARSLARTLSLSLALANSFSFSPLMVMGTTFEQRGKVQ